MSINNSSPWKNEKYFSSYEEADELKRKLLSSDKTSTLQVKIKRSGEGGCDFVVKSRQNPAALAELQELEEKFLLKKNKKK